MKRFYTILASAALAMTSTMSADKLPVIYSANFDVDGVFEQWTQYGLGRELMNDTQTRSIWGVADAKPYALISAGSQDWAWAASTSNFADISASNPADEWLVSPSFKMTYDNAILSYRAFATNTPSLNCYDNQFIVKVSDKGNAKADFPDTHISQGELNFKSATYTATLNGFKDKDLNLAFINVSTAPGILGFNNIDVMQYYISIENNTPIYSHNATVTLRVAMHTPMACKGFKAFLKSSTGVEDVYESDAELSESLQKFDITFNNILTVEETKFVTYTVTIIPNFEGALASEIDGRVDGYVNYIDSVYSNDSIIVGDIYNFQGICLKRNAIQEDVNALSPGLYIIGGKKVSVQ